MNIYRVREKLKCGKTIYDIPLKVVYYARVSTLKEEQHSSIINQQDYYKDFISNNPNWTLVHEYIDEGISGMHTDKREEFQHMVKDAKKGKFDMIVTKEIARFARNTLDSIRYTRELLGCGVVVWFQTDSINTIDEDSELRLAIMSSLAQDELRKLSNRIKFGHSQSIKKGRILGTDNLYGYRKQNAKLSIVEDEAEMVRTIFRLYATGEWTTPKIEQHLYDLGYRNSKGGKINRRVIGNIITNPKYKGFFCGGKVKVIDMFTKKQEFLPEDEWTMFRDETGEIVPAIVDESLWQAANNIFAERGKIIKERRTSYKEGNIYTGKIICGIDGCHYWLKMRQLRGEEVNIWRCSHKMNQGADSCSSVNIRESELNNMFATLLNEHAINTEEIKQKYIDIYKKIIQQRHGKEDKKSYIEKQLNEILDKKERLLDMSLDGIITKEDFKAKNDELTKKYTSLKEQLNGIASDTDDDNFSAQLDKILSVIKEYKGIKAEDIDKQLVEKIIDKIIITPVEGGKETVEFFLKDGNLFNGELKSCSVNAVKKMIEAQERMMADKSNG